jgi:hypothetical protein
MGPGLSHHRVCHGRLERPELDHNVSKGERSLHAWMDLISQTDPLPSPQERLTLRRGAIWHMVLGRTAEYGIAVTAEPGTFLDFRIRQQRVVLWKHSQELGSGLRELLTLDLLSVSIMVVALLAFMAYARLQSTCRACCSSSARPPPAGERDGCEAVSCTPDDRQEADQCISQARVLMYGAVTLLMVGSGLRMANALRKKKGKSQESGVRKKLV